MAISSTATGNAVLGNSIYGNAGLGIDLGNDGVTANDGSMSGSAAGQGMDSPVFTTANLVSNTLTVSGYIDSAPNQTAFAGARVEIYLAATDPSNHGEGQTHLGFPTADANGNFTGTLDVSGNGLIDEQVLATNTGATVAENSTGNTISTVMLDTTDVDNIDDQLVYTITTVAKRRATVLHSALMTVRAQPRPVPSI